MKKLKNFAKILWQNESGQGMAEYVLLLVIVVGIIVAFGPQIKGAVQKKMGEVTGQIDNFNP